RRCEALPLLQLRRRDAHRPLEVLDHPVAHVEEVLLHGEVLRARLAGSGRERGLVEVVGDADEDRADPAEPVRVKAGKGHGNHGPHWMVTKDWRSAWTTVRPLRVTTTDSPGP